ncbi:MAG: Ig-like domain-containing protein, partial [Clostridia bacterium]|nr:Ig-like domain-containing protein [Clostridia bacterium]
INLDPPSRELFIGEALQLKWALVPENADGAHSIAWQSSDPSVASVDSQGLLNAIAEGTTTITATLENGESDSIAATVKNIRIKSFKLNKTRLTISEGGSSKLKISNVKPADAATVSAIWTSSDENVARVDENGIVRGVGMGVANITARLGSIQKNCRVTVSAPKPDGLTPNMLAITLRPGEKLKVGAYVSPERASQKVNYSVEHKRIASVSSKGVITAKSVGMTSLYIQTPNGWHYELSILVSGDLRPLSARGLNRPAAIWSTEDSFSPAGIVESDSPLKSVGWVVSHRNGDIYNQFELSCEGASSFNLSELYPVHVMFPGEYVFYLQALNQSGLAETLVSQPFVVR